MNHEKEMKANEVEAFYLTAVCEALKAEIASLIAIGELAESLNRFNIAARAAQNSFTK